MGLPVALTGEHGFVALPSKISVPIPKASSVIRSGVQAKLQRVCDYAVTTVVSPAGFGKSTAVTNWAVSQDMPVAWFLAEAEDARLDRFWTYLVASVISAYTVLEKTLGKIEADWVHQPSASIDALLFELGAWGNPVIIVIEDFHTVQENDDVRLSVDYFIRHLPSNVHVVLTSRQRIDLSLVRLKLAEKLNELHEDDLRFTSSEQDQLFKMGGVELSLEHGQMVYCMTQGWPAGAKLVSLLCGSGTENEVMHAMCQVKSDVNAYLFDEVFRSLSEPLQNFLLHTCPVGSFCLPLAERLCESDREHTASWLDEIVKNDLFIERMGQKNGEMWYRYHQLFADMLRDRLSRQSRAHVCDLKRRARDWFLETHYYDAAVELSVELGDYQSVCNLITTCWQQLYMSDNHCTLTRWARFLPDEEVKRRPMVCAVLAMPYALENDAERASTCLEQALDKLHEGDDFLVGFCAAQQALIASFQGDQEGMRLYTDEALRILSKREYYLRGIMLQVQASSYLYENPLVAKALYLQSLDEQLRYGNANLTCSAYANLAYICASLGHLDEAKQYVRRAFSVYDEVERPNKGMLSYAYVVEMVCAYEDGRFEEVLTHYDALQELSRRGLVSAILAQGQTLRAKALKRLGHLEADQEFFDALAYSKEGALAAFPSLEYASVYAKAYGSTANGDSGECVSLHQVQLFDYAVLYCMDHVSLFEEVCTYVDAFNSDERYAYVYGLVLAAAFAEKVAHVRRAEDYLERAVVVASAYKLPMILEDNARFLSCIAQRLSKNAEASVVAYLTEHVLQVGQQQAEYALTDRELDVMRLVATGSTVAQAAEQLYVSRETVKKHLANIYAKLGVHSKMQAVALLREIGMI